MEGKVDLLYGKVETERRRYLSTASRWTAVCSTAHSHGREGSGGLARHKRIATLPWGAWSDGSNVIYWTFIIENLLKKITWSIHLSGESLHQVVKLAYISIWYRIAIQLLEKRAPKKTFRKKRRKYTRSVQKVHFPRFPNKRASRKAIKTAHKCFKCSSKDLL